MSVKFKKIMGSFKVTANHLSTWASWSPKQSFGDEPKRNSVDDDFDKDDIEHLNAEIDSGGLEELSVLSASEGLMLLQDVSDLLIEELLVALTELPSPNSPVIPFLEGRSYDPALIRLYRRSVAAACVCKYDPTLEDCVERTCNIAITKLLGTQTRTYHNRLGEEVMKDLRQLYDLHG